MILPEIISLRNNNRMSKKERKPVVVVVSTAASAFPDFSEFGGLTKKNDFTRKSKRKKGIGIDLDFDDTVREIHKLGSTQFIGKQKKEYEAEQYKKLTGREKKKQKVPVKIVRGIKKAAAKRDARNMKEMKEAGVVTAVKNTSQKKSYSEKNRRDSRIHGPSPSAGYMSKGIMRVVKK